MLHWEQHQMDDQEVWTGTNSMIQLTIAPQLGSKVISLKNLKTGREWLSRTDQPLGNKGYASSFADNDGSGWDEMFPTINACHYPTFPWQGVELPDHGEVWSIPWHVIVHEGQLSSDVYGVRMPYHLKKSYSFTKEQRLRIDYSVQNLSSFPFSFLWAAHPLFQVEEGMEIIVPRELDTIVVSYSQDGRLGQMGDIQKWPIPFADQGQTRLNLVEAAAARTAEKYYFQGELPEGKASLYDPVTEEQLTIIFPKEKVPYLSIWANAGGYQGQYHVAIEPATGFLDDLSYAMEHKAVAVVEAQGTYDWFIEIELSTAKKIRHFPS
ncbi:hypothetical protein ACP8HI_18705 [Paenibacillus sp. FA6]|uniref:aldose epimerase family protein n=1 Tax=Paenibacillus sp. FA6 TaxID=3413029 RepID=UPI003F6550A3